MTTEGGRPGQPAAGGAAALAATGVCAAASGVAAAQAPCRAYIGLGANLGDARAALEAACEAMAGLPGVHLRGRSSLYRSAPVDAGGPDYLNAVAALDTSLDPWALLQALLGIEARHGRERPYFHAPRTLDLDLLLYGDLCLERPGLTLPHPRGHLRAFVLQPLHELAPGLHWPGQGPLAGLIAATAAQRIERLVDEPSGLWAAGGYGAGRASG